MTEMIKIKELEQVIQRMQNPSNLNQHIYKWSENGKGVISYSDGDGIPLIIKIWGIKQKKEQFKSQIRLSNGFREWRMQKYLLRFGIQTPTPFEFKRIRINRNQKYEIMIVEDLGETTLGLDYLKKLYSMNDFVSAEKFEQSVLECTEKILNLCVIDIDHQLNNFIVDKYHKLYRTDFECAQKYLWIRQEYRDYAKMLARLISSHVYAVQPEVHHSVHFSDLLYSRLRIKPEIRRKINSIVYHNLSEQKKIMCVDTQLSLPE